MWIRLWRDEAGTVLTTEVVLLTTLLIIGIVVGAKSYRDSLVTEWGDYAQALANVDQSYNVPDGATTGSGFLDQRDFCDTDAVDHGPDVPSSNPDIFGDGPFVYAVEPPGEGG
ncbi:MAG: hypothetical protein KJ000_03535 [Pirellulaceae bacterium]|nr:hypothetical protein [Pirellulaceae bacterium]